MAQKKFLPPPPGDLLQGAVLFLDFDGTLVELVSRHDAVRVEARLGALMKLLGAKLKGRLAIISGRSAATIGSLFGPPAFAIGGSHGLELHWPDGRKWAPPRLELSHMLAELRQFSESHPGVIVEEKPFGVALHYRLTPEAEDACRQFVARVAKETGMTLQAGKMVVELKAAGADKGTAVEAFMREPPMRGGRPIFIGDDVTDEAGFDAAARLGGAGVLVGAPRPTAALYRLAGVDKTLLWLEAACEQLT